MNMDAIIHEPARLLLMSILAGTDAADFALLLSTTGLTRGNLSSHMSRLEHAGYVMVKKGFIGRIPHTEYRLTPQGREALAQYWRTIDDIRRQYHPPEG